MRRVVPSRAASVLSFVYLLGCGDELPVYPPIVVINVGANVGGSGNTGTGNTGNRPAGNSGSSQGQGGDPDPGGGDVLYPHCDDPWQGPDPEPQTACDLDALEDGGELSGDISADRVLESGHSYVLKGSTRVMPGVTLTIQPCVKVIGQNSDAVLLVRAGDLGDPEVSCTYDSGSPGPGGKLVAIGEPMAPIIFTSAKPPGSRAPGDWGGIIINGNARNGAMLVGSKARRIAEGLEKSECFGWDTDEFNTESSGNLEYVRVEYASRQLAQNNETNGLTFNALGSGTVISHVMVSNSADDCFEWFGGTVNADHLIALNCDDDMFDADEGYVGQVQFVFGRQFATTTEDTSFGLEISNGALAGNATPFTSVSFSNMTLCGGGPTDKDNRRASVVANSASVPVIENALLTGFAGGGISIATFGAPTFKYTSIWDNPIGNGLVFGSATMSGFDPADGNSAETPDRFCDCWAALPQAVLATPVPGGTPSGDDPDATYEGAFADSSAESNWMRGLWVDFSED